MFALFLEQVSVGIVAALFVRLCLVLEESAELVLEGLSGLVVAEAVALHVLHALHVHEFRYFEAFLQDFLVDSGDVDELREVNLPFALQTLPGL